LTQDSRDKVIHAEKSEYVISKRSAAGALGVHAARDMYLALTTFDARENSGFINKSFATAPADGGGSGDCR